MFLILMSFSSFGKEEFKKYIKKKPQNCFSQLMKRFRFMKVLYLWDTDFCKIIKISCIQKHGNGNTVNILRYYFVSLKV